MKTNKSFLIALSLILFIPVLCYLYFFVFLSDTFMKSPKIYGERKGVEKVIVDGKEKVDTIYHTISDFKVVNQNGDTVTHKDYENKFYVANFFFSTCKTICPKMTFNLSVLQKMYKKDKNINFKILSFSVDPETDTVAALKEYAERFEVKDTLWNLVTGDKEHIYELARKSFMLPVGEGDGGEHDFIHSEIFVLVDKEKHIRGLYNGTDSLELKKLADDIVLLHLIEKKKNKKRKHFLN